MNNYQIRIELLSDLCVSAGEGYNSAVDMDICYDSYGFPYIPGKRLKGCLRECAIELNDWGKAISIRGLFGDEGDARAACRIGNAYLEDAEEMKHQIDIQPSCPLYHPQNVLNQFSYIRTQTSINYDTSVVDKGMLRTMRVANKALVFVADVVVEDEYVEDLALCCKILRHMGIARTRGLGEIRVSLVSAKSWEKESVCAPLCEKAVSLEYKIRIEDPVICKSVAGGEAKTLDYIEGNKVFGIIAGALKKDGKSVVDFLDEGELVCSNAYLGENGVRFTEVPACYYSIKNVKDEYIDRTLSSLEEEKDLQLNSMKHAYAALSDHGLVLKNVDVEERYHHRRPEDKSIGRAVENSDKSGFYHISSISPRQEFYGFIQGTENQIKQIYTYLSSQKEFYIGFSRHSEYGRVTIEIIKTEEKKAAESVLCKEFLVKLEAPVLLYNDNAFYSVDMKHLKEEVELELGICPENILSVQGYMKYVTLGGFNVTWGYRKPIVEAFDKGTVLHYKLKEAVELNLLSHYFLGERITEGYGEVTVMPFVSDNAKARRTIAKSIQNHEDAEYVVAPGGLMEKIAETSLKSYVKSAAIHDAEIFVKKLGGRKEERHGATVNNMISMCKECADYPSVRASVSARFDKKNDVKVEKGELAYNILKFAEENTAGLLDKFCFEYHLKWNYEADLKLLYLKELLIALKYIFR